VDTFSYLSGMTAILLGLGLFQLFAGIGNLLQVRQRVQPYWLHSLWVLIIILSQVNVWWSFWALRESVTWTYGLFLYLLLGPARLVIVSHLLMPSELYGAGLAEKFDLQRHYYDTSHLFFGILAGVMTWALLLEPVLGVRPLLLRFRVLQALGLVLIGSCAISKNRVLHAITAVGVLGLLLIVIFLIRARAGSFGPQ
jgi:hypothetical protein